MSSGKIPTRFKEALGDPKWAESMNEEIRVLEKNQTWDILTLPKWEKPVRCKWVFLVKHNLDGSIDRFKARLVALGFTQTYSVDYQQTFVPVAKLSTVPVLLSTVANLDWPLY